MGGRNDPIDPCVVSQLLLLYDFCADTIMYCVGCFVVKAIGLVALFGAAPFVSAQGQPGTSPPPLKACSTKNPPPCATPPKAVYSPDPEFTQKARKKKFNGTIILETTVGTDGHTYDIRVVQPAKYGLDEQAVKALRQWKFEPGTKDGQPVPVSIQVEVDFRLY